MLEVEDGEIDDTLPRQPNCPTCLQRMEPGHDLTYWACPDGHILLIDEVTHPSWGEGRGNDE